MKFSVVKQSNAHRIVLVPFQTLCSDAYMLLVWIKDL